MMITGLPAWSATQWRREPPCKGLQFLNMTWKRAVIAVAMFATATIWSSLIRNGTTGASVSIRTVMRMALSVSLLGHESE